MKLKTTAGLAILLAQFGWAQAEGIYSPQQGERLSGLLMREQLLPGTARNSQGQTLQLTGMVLQRAELRNQQELKKTQLITQLIILGPGKVPAYLKALVESLPATGRQLLPSQDGHEMAAKAQLDPVLQAGDRLTVPITSNFIAVLGSQGQCIAEFRPEVAVPAYLEQCFPKSHWFEIGYGFDNAWLVQPTGEVIKLNTGLWNQTEQALPQPGAWVWAPSRNSDWNEVDNQQLVEFLRTQGAYTNNNTNADTITSLTRIISAPEQTTTAANNTAVDYTVRPTRSDWGSVGLLQMPSARMAEEGTISLTASRVEPYSRYSFIYQPFEWLEAGFRYSIITNRQFGRFDFSGDRKYQDKSVDLKLRLLDETVYLPEVAMGLRDIGGTGLFSSEYLVASKRAGKFDFTLGLGFGNMATGGGVSNPFGFISEEFDRRPQVNFGAGGEANANTYFRGDAALFGGVEWQTPLRDLILKVEVDGNDYSDEPRNNPQEQSSDINYGAVYRINDLVDFSVSIQRGNTMGFALSFKENVSKYSVPKLTDPKPVVVTQGPRPTSTDWEKTVKLIEQQTTWDVESVQQRGSEVQLTVKNADVTYPAKAVDKATAALHENVAEGINWFSFAYKNRGADVAEHVVDRTKWAADKTELPIEKVNDNPVAAVEPNGYIYKPLHTDYDPWYSGGTGIGYEQTFGGANGYLFQFTAYARGEIEFTDSTWLTGRIDHVLGGTFDKFTQRGTSNLPQVRTNFREYSTASDTKLTNLQLNHIGQLSQDNFYSLYGGYLESMFGGVGGEYLHRPMNSRWALGVDLNKVKQRAFEQDLSFRDYTVSTGHITAYVDTGFEDILATVSVGQYLAGDKGVTVDLSRVFDNGVKIGAYATKTNVSAEDFGEGSFDKGIYLRVPFDALFTSTVPGDASFNWVQVTRDGGAKLRRTLSLFEETSTRSPRALQFKPTDQP